VMCTSVLAVPVAVLCAAVSRCTHEQNTVCNKTVQSSLRLYIPRICDGYTTYTSVVCDMCACVCSGAP